MPLYGCTALAGVDWDRVVLRGADGGVSPSGGTGGGHCPATQVDCLRGCCAPNDAPGEVSQLAAGGENTCVVTTTGLVRCWGGNGAGQLGRGADFRVPFLAKPTTVSLITSSAKAVAVGRGHACAIVDAQMACWGSGGQGQLGVGSAASSSVPVVIERLPGPPELVAAGNQTTCAVVAGSLYCWGDNGGWQAGNELTVSQLIPTSAASLDGAVTAIAVGAEGHSCAALARGGVSCWGNNTQNRLGHAGISLTGAGVAVTGLPSTQASALAAGTYHACAAVQGALACWGGNTFGELGDPRVTSASSGAVNNELTVGVTSVCAGFGFTCAVQSGAVRCFGTNADGQLGNGSRQPSSLPVTAKVSGPARTVACGQMHACALLESGKVQCWGNGSQGQLGNNGVEAADRPVDVLWP